MENIGKRGSAGPITIIGLIAVRASITANCQPCFQDHIKKALENRADEQEIAAALANWVNLTAGLLLVVFVGLLILQSAFTDWCPVDLIPQPLGLKSKLKSQKI
jgi:AhpD family alkylhydroperoxidase